MLGLTEANKTKIHCVLCANSAWLQNLTQIAQIISHTDYPTKKSSNYFGNYIPVVPDYCNIAESD